MRQRICSLTGWDVRAAEDGQLTSIPASNDLPDGRTRCGADPRIPYLVPEIQLLYKAPGMRPKDLADFEGVLPTLSVPARVWLGRALTIAHPEHTWLDRLGSSAG